MFFRLLCMDWRAFVDLCPKDKLQLLIFPFSNFSALVLNSARERDTGIAAGLKPRPWTRSRSSLPVGLRLVHELVLPTVSRQAGRTTLSPKTVIFVEQIFLFSHRWPTADTAPPPAPTVLSRRKNFGKNQTLQRNNHNNTTTQTTQII